MSRWRKIIRELTHRGIKTSDARETTTTPHNSNQIKEVGEVNFSESLMVMYSEPEPSQIDNSEQEEDLISSATAWVQENLIKPDQQFGVDFKVCQREALLFLTKLDQMREKEKVQGERGKEESRLETNNTVPAELRNLFFDMNFKDGEPRSSGRMLFLTYQ